MIYSVFSLRIGSASVLLQSSVLIDLWETVVKLTESAGAQPYVPCTKSMCSDERIQIVKRIILKHTIFAFDSYFTLYTS